MRSRRDYEANFHRPSFYVGGRLARWGQNLSASSSSAAWPGGGGGEGRPTNPTPNGEGRPTDPVSAWPPRQMNSMMAYRADGEVPDSVRDYAKSAEIDFSPIPPTSTKSAARQSSESSNFGSSRDLVAADKGCEPPHKSAGHRGITVADKDSSDFRAENSNENVEAASGSFVTGGGNVADDERVEAPKENYLSNKSNYLKFETADKGGESPHIGRSLAQFGRGGGVTDSKDSADFCAESVESSRSSVTGTENVDGRNKSPIQQYLSKKSDNLKFEESNPYCTSVRRFRWVDDMEARHSIIIALTAFYAMVLTIFALVFELSRLLSGESRRDVGYKDLFFGVYMYGTSITFLGYCYVVLLLNPRWRQNLERAKRIIGEKRIRRKKLADSMFSPPPGKPQQSASFAGQIFQSNSMPPPPSFPPRNFDASQSNAFALDASQNNAFGGGVMAESSLNNSAGSSIQFGSMNSSDSQSVELGSSRKVSHDSPSAGSLFLRLGCIVFGVIGMVYYAFSAYLCASDVQCYGMVIFLDALAILFVFSQMHFVFCNWKLSITGSQVVARFGTMHLIAANLWTWIRYILLEESTMNDEIRQVFTRDATIVGPDMKTPLNRTMMPTCQGAECVLASMSEVMYTSIVEYSLISAGVMLIVWRNIDFERKVVVYVKRKHQIRINCSKTTNGLFLGLAYLAGTFTTMAIFSGYTLMGQNRLAAMVFGCSDITQYSLASLGCLLALWQMRQLHFNTPYSPSSSSTASKEHSSSVARIMGYANANTDSITSSAASAAAVVHAKRSHNHSQDLLDIILLGFGMTGEMIYSVAGLLGLSAYEKWETLSTILLLVHVTRISQVGLQSCLIYIAGKLSVQGDEVLRRKQPGKQAITFLLLANISMFLMNLLEAEKAGVSDAVVDFYGRRSWVFLVRSFSPLTIFYRFHSSVCLAEVWKTTYSSKD